MSLLYRVFLSGTTSDWTATNPILRDGEVGLDRTLKILKIGNGQTRWNSLGLLELTPSSIDVTNLVANMATKVTKGSHMFDVRDYGAVAGAANSSVGCQAAIAAASAVGGGIVFAPAGVFSVALNVPSNITLRGVGNATEFRATGGDALTLSGIDIRIEDCQVSSVSGHCINAPNVTRLTLKRVQIVQYLTDKHLIYHNAATAFVDVRVVDCEFNAASGATVSPIYLENSGNNLAATRWRDLRLNGANIAVPFIRMRNTLAATWAHDHKFEDITAELCAGGVIHGSSMFGVTLDGVVAWDATTYTNHIFWFDKEASSSAPRAISIRSSARRGGAMGVGKSDIFVSTDALNVTVDNCRPSTGTLIASIPYSLAVINNSDNSDSHYGYGVAVGIPHPSTGDRFPANVVDPGSMLYDTTLGKPVWSDGTNWRDAVGTIV